MADTEDDFAWDCNVAHRQSLEDFVAYIAAFPQWWQHQLDTQDATADAQELTGWLKFSTMAIANAKENPIDYFAPSESTDVYVALKYVIGLINDQKIDWLGQDADLQRMRILNDAMHALMWVKLPEEPDTDAPSN